MRNRISNADRFYLLRNVDRNHIVHIANIVKFSDDIFKKLYNDMVDRLLFVSLRDSIILIIHLIGSTKIPVRYKDVRNHVETKMHIISQDPEKNQSVIAVKICEFIPPQEVVWQHIVDTTKKVMDIVVRKDFVVSFDVFEDEEEEYVYVTADF